MAMKYMGLQVGISVEIMNMSEFIRWCSSSYSGQNLDIRYEDYTVGYNDYWGVLESNYDGSDVDSFSANFIIQVRQITRVEEAVVRQVLISVMPLMMPMQTNCEYNFMAMA